MRHSTSKATNIYEDNLNGTHSLIIKSNNREMKYLVDSEDVPRLKALHWQIQVQGKNLKRHYLRCAISRVPRQYIMAHSLILSFPDSECVDHINRDTQDNRKCNLKPTSIGNNSKNRSKCKRKYFDMPLGVRRTPQGKYRSVIGVDRKYIHLGIFDTPDEAHLAYQKKREEVLSLL